MPKYLNREGVKSFYDRIGAAQDLQKYYEYPAVQELIAHADFDRARAIFEFGCGTGAFAARILTEEAQAPATYLGVDISPKMVKLAREKLVPFQDRAEVILTDGSLEFDFPNGHFDRFVANYVMDLLSVDDTRILLEEAYRMLLSEGLLSIISLTHGETAFSGMISTLWSKVCDLTPAAVGGCRPIELVPHLDRNRWDILYRAKIAALGVTSLVLIAKKIAV